MTMTSYPFNNQDTSETMYSDLFREFQDTGVAASAVGSALLLVTADGSGMNVKMGGGFAIIRGFAFNSTTTETLVIEAATSTARVDAVVLRLDPATDGIVPLVVKGPGGTTPPALQSSAAGQQDLLLAYVTVRANTTSIIAADVDDRRSYIGSRVGVWDNDTRPVSPRASKLGYNTSTNKWEYFLNNTWNDLAPTINWSAVSGTPAIFPTNWSSVAGKPTTFPPASHTHQYHPVSPSGRYVMNHATNDVFFDLGFRWDGRPIMRVDSVEFVLAKEVHGHQDLYDFMVTGLESKANKAYSPTSVDRAEGSDRPHLFSPAGSNWYSVWVDGNRNFCRNTSSIRYKENVRSYEFEKPQGVLALEPVIYDRKPTTAEDGTVTEGRKDEIGLIAEAVAKHVPEIVTYHDGVIDAVRYDLLALAMLPVLKDQERRIKALEEALGL